MKSLKVLNYVAVFFICFFSFNYSIGQTRNISKDTLRIKVYTEIEYVQGRMKKLTVTKVFCDYCSPAQIEALKEQIKEIVYREKRYWTYGKINDIYKHTMILSVSREDLLAIKNEENKN